MSLLAVAVYAQLFDLVTYLVAMSMPYGQEGWFAADLGIDRVVQGKLAAVVVLVAAWSCTRIKTNHPELTGVLIGAWMAWGVYGAVTNVLLGWRVG